MAGPSTVGPPRLRCGERSPDGDVVVGRDGWLFLARGGNAWMNQYRGLIAPPPGWAPAWREVIAHRRAIATEHGARGAHLVVPDKLALYPELAPPGCEPLAARPAERLLNHRILRDATYPVPALMAAKRHAPVFPKTDTHVTAHGARTLYLSVMTQLGLPVSGAHLDRPLDHHVVSGDLGVHFDPPVPERFAVPARTPSLEVAFEELPDGGHYGMRRVIRNRAPLHDLSILVFGGSHTAVDVAHPGTLGELLARTFALTTFVWMPFGCDPALVARMRPDAVLFQTTERFLLEVPPLRDSAGQGSTSPRRMAYRVSSTRSRMPSLPRMFSRWRSTVRRLITSASAI
jgi:alginate O-acetyltransferase complex protein AlgJ